MFKNNLQEDEKNMKKKIYLRHDDGLIFYKSYKRNIKSITTTYQLRYHKKINPTTRYKSKVTKSKLIAKHYKAKILKKNNISDISNLEK